MIEVKISSTPLSLDDCMQKAANPSCGGIVSFVGTARDKTDGRRVLRLEFEAYETMAISEMDKIARDASSRWPIDSLIIHHRDGAVQAGETAVIIVASAERRDAAFQACRYAIDELKKRVPIWKKEVFADGAEWVTPHP